MNENSTKDVDAFLEHFGVKGMHWGQHRVERFKKNRALNKVAKAKQQRRDEAHLNQLRKTLRPDGKNLSRAQDIQRARDRISTGALRADKKAAKAQYKKDKIKIGSKEARRILRTKKKALAKDIRRSEQAKDGFEVAQRLIDEFAYQAEVSRYERKRSAEKAATLNSQFSTTRG